MTNTDTKTKYPSAVYAAAGVGDFVYETLRKLQDKAIAFGTEAGTQAPEWKKKVADLGAKVDANKVRETVVTGTQFAAEKATEVYSTLVNRGERAFAAQKPAPAAKAHTAKAAAKPEAAKADAGKAEPTAPVAKKAAPAVKKAAPAKKTV